MKSRSFVLSMIIVTLFSGCTMAPKYERPAAPIPADWPKGTAYQEIKTPGDFPQVKELPWREFFTDERLKKITETALSNNRDLRLAALNAEKVKALYGIQRAELLPSVNAIGSGSKGRTPADLSYSKTDVVTEQYSVSLGVVSWEIDFFGRIRSLKDRAWEEYMASDQAHRSAQTILVSAVAGTYYTLAADRDNLELVTSTLKTQETAYNLIRKRQEVGLASELDLRRSQTQVDSAKRDVALYTQLAAQDENALNLLVGTNVTQELMPANLASVSPPKTISAGLSSEVLLGRPDVLAAEHRLKAANASIGAARAAFFPRISLTSTIGTASAELAGLFRAGSKTWTFAPQIVMPIFDARTWAAYDYTKVEKEIYIAQYEKAIQTAFREAADALAVKGTIDSQIAAQKSLVEAASSTYRLSALRYAKGIDSYLSVLDAQRSLYAAQQGLISLRLAQIVNMLTLYKVLGGGA